MAENITELGQAGGLIMINTDDPIGGTAVPIVNWLIILSTLVAVIFLIVSGYTLITSGGDPEKVSKGQGGLTASIVGLIIIFIAKAVAQLIIERAYS